MGRFSDAIKAEISSYAGTSWSGDLGGQTITLTATPITPKDMSVIRRTHPDFQTNPSLAGMLDMIILKARDESGEVAFDLTDKPFLMRISASKVGEIFGGLFGSQFEAEDEQGFEDRKKN